MNGFFKTSLFQATFFAGLAIILGLSLSYIVFNLSTKIKENTYYLVDDHIPILNSTNQIIETLIAQERNVYEYFTTQNNAMFVSKQNTFNNVIKTEYQFITQQEAFKNQKSLISESQDKTELLYKEFHQVVENREQYDPNIYWDTLRALLVKISLTKKDMLVILQDIKKTNQESISQAKKATYQQVAKSHQIVIFYSICIVILGALIAWYIRQSIVNNAKMNRLALFPHRNPNPIVSINSQGNIAFTNPAYKQLLIKLEYTYEDVYKILPQNFSSICQQLNKDKLQFINVEQSVKNLVLQYNINYLQDISAYDIHIVDITERKLAENKVQKLAFYQQTTHLPNQYKLYEDLKTRISQNKEFTLGIFSIRDFNKIVMAYGVEVSENLVQQFCTKLQKKFNHELYLYQLNESQFSLICKEKNNVIALQLIAEKIISIAEKPLTTLYGDFFIELNFGFSLYPDHGENRNSLIKNAHSALSISVADQHRYFSLFNNQVELDLAHNITIIDNLRNAIANNELFLVFQPQLHLTTQKITGIETLVRWKHQGKLISPVEFIPLAEQSGLIVPIGQWILEQACLFAKKLVLQGHNDIVVAVNISPRQFSHPDFLASVIQTLEKTQLDAKNLELEITEGVFMHNEEVTLCVLNKLKKNGIQLSIDDFGTGYSSLSYLKRFPINKLKIDQSFIRDCHNNNEDKSIVTTIVALGKNLNLTLIAEGVEELVHVDFLKEIHCDEIQGYWYSRPLEKDALITFMAHQLTQNSERL